MNFDNPAAWSLAALGLLIAAMYLWVFRRRTHEVAAFMLWQRALARRPAWLKLRLWLSLSVQIAVLLLLVAALAEPFWTALAARRRNLVLVVDVSASMTAMDVPPQRLAAAQDAARRIIGGLQPGEQAAVVAAGGSIRTVCPFTDRPERLVAAVDSLTSDGGGTRVAEAVSLARRMLDSRPNPRVIVLTDGCFAEAAALAAAEDVKLLCFGEAGNNVGITQLAARPRDTGQAEVFVKIEGRLQQAATGRLRLQTAAGHGGSQPALDVSLPAGEVHESRFVSLPIDRAGTLTAELQLTDHLSADNAATAVVLASRRMTVALIGGGGSRLEAALKSLPELDVTVAAAAAEVAKADVWIFGDGLPDGATLPDAPCLVIGPAGSNELWTLAGTLRDSAAIVKTVRLDSPLLADVRLTDALIEEAAQLEIRLPHQVLASAASGEPLYAAIDRPTGPVLVFAANLAKSDLALRPDFPRLIQNAVRWFASRKSTAAAEVATNSAAKIIPPLEARESDLTRDPSLPPADLSAFAVSRDQPLALLLLGAALILLLADSILLNRRLLV